MSKQIISGQIGLDSTIRIPDIRPSPKNKPKFVPCKMCGGSGVIKCHPAIGTCGNCMGSGKEYDFDTIF